MARETRRSNTERFRYGMCLNDECSKCKSKEVQKIPVRKEFVCEECGKELRECPPPKKNSKLLPLIIAAVILLAAIIGGIIAFSDGFGNKIDTAATDSIAAKDTAVVVPALPDTVIKHDTVVVRDTIVKNNTITTREKVSTKTVVSTTSSSKAQTSTSTKGSLRLSYGKYTGATKNGYPHGQGKLTYSTSRVINRNDVKGRTADAGDYVIGEFYNGFVVYGKHYDAYGNLIGSLNFGVGSEDSYDSK